MYTCPCHIILIARIRHNTSILCVHVTTCCVSMCRINSSMLVRCCYATYYTKANPLRLFMSNLDYPHMHRSVLGSTAQSLWQIGHTSIKPI